MESPVYPDHIKIKDALQVYFTAHGFNEGGYKDKFYYIVLGPLRIPVPNTRKRIMAVKFHDIHHLLTGYNARWNGEVQIGAWELASGCGKFVVAWILNFGSFGVGLFLYPRLLFKAFISGRQAKANLYYGYSYNNELLERTLGDLRAELRLGQPSPAKVADYLSFGFWTLLVLLEIVLLASVFCFLIESILH